MSKKGNNYYFDGFAKGIFHAGKAASLLQDCLEDLTAGNLKRCLDEMHKLEQAGNELKQETAKHLMKEFLPPMEREDVSELSYAIYNMTDAAKNVLQGLYMFRITTLHFEVKEFVRLILHCCTVMEDISKELYNFRKSAVLHEKTMEMNKLKAEGDRLYTDAMRHLYMTEKNPITLLSQTIIYNRLKKCCECCGHAADMVEHIIIKNS